MVIGDGVIKVIALCEKSLELVSQGPRFKNERKIHLNAHVLVHYFLGSDNIDVILLAFIMCVVIILEYCLSSEYW